MTRWKSTLGAPLSEAEEARIEAAWANLRGYTDQMAGADPVAMLNHVAEIVAECWEVRRAVDDAWFYANKRAFPGPESRPRAKPKSVDLLQQLEGLDVSPDELAAALAAVRSK